MRTTRPPIVLAPLMAASTLLLVEAAVLGSAHQRAAAVPDCTPRHLSATSSQPGGGGPEATVRVELRNTAGTACRLRGPLRLTLRNEAGKLLPTRQLGGADPASVVLRPGGRAGLTITYSVPGAGEATPTTRSIQLAFTGGPGVTVPVTPIAAAQGQIRAGELTVS